MAEEMRKYPINDDTESYQKIQLDEAFLSLIRRASSAMIEAGYDPIMQLTGYIRTGNDQYITRTGGAREIVAGLAMDQIRVYLGRYSC